MPVLHSKSQSQIIPINLIHNVFFSETTWPMLRSSSVTLEALTTATCITIKFPLFLIHHRYQKSSMISNESTSVPLLLLLLEAPFHLEKYNDRSRFKHTNDNDHEPFLECFHQKNRQLSRRLWRLRRRYPVKGNERTEAIDLHNTPKLSFDKVLIYDTYLLPLLICKQHTFRIINPRPTNLSANGILANHHRHSLITGPVPVLFKRLLINKLPERTHCLCHYLGTRNVTWPIRPSRSSPVLSCLPNYLHLSICHTHTHRHTHVFGRDPGSRCTHGSTISQQREKSNQICQYLFCPMHFVPHQEITNSGPVSVWLSDIYGSWKKQISILWNPKL